MSVEKYSSNGRLDCGEIGLSASLQGFLQHALSGEPIFNVMAVLAISSQVQYYGRTSVGALGALYNAFLLVMTLAALADNGLFFLLLSELMSLVSYFLVVTELLIDRSDPLAANIACCSYSINMFDLLHLKNSARTNRGKV